MPPHHAEVRGQDTFGDRAVAARAVREGAGPSRPAVSPRHDARPSHREGRPRSGDRYLFKNSDGPLVCRKAMPSPGLSFTAAGLVTQFLAGSGSATQVSDTVPQKTPSAGEVWMSRKSNMLPPSCASHRPGPHAPRWTGSFGSFAVVQVKVGWAASALGETST